MITSVAFFAIMLLPVAMAQTIPGEEDFTNSTGPTAHTSLDITTLQSYKIDPKITEDMLRLESDDPPLTVEFGVAFDELHLIIFGYEDHIRPQYVEFLEDLEITVLGVVGNVLEVSIHPSQEDRLDEIKKQLGIMYPDVDIDLTISPGLIYVDTITKTSTVNTAIPNGLGSLSNTIDVSNNATLNSITVSITVNHEDHDENYIKLTPPNENAITLFSRERGHADGVQTFTYSSTTNSHLAKLVGKNISGDWLLNVRDAYRGSDRGTLQSWSLTFDATPTATTSDNSNTNGDETTNENLLEQFFNLIFGDISCNNLRDDCVPKVAGQYISYIGRTGTERHSSIGLGGLNTTDGVEGFIISGHAPGHGNVGKVIAHELTDTDGNVQYTKPLGVVVINNGNITSSGYFKADVAFVEYPKECVVTETQLCYGETNNYKETVKPFEIFKSNGNTYTVTSYDSYPTRNTAVNAIGSGTQTLFSGTINDNFQAVQTEDGYTYVALATFNAMEGDSGGPVFSTPNTDDEVEFVGIIMGVVQKNNINYTGFVPWYKIQSDLGLQSSIP